MKIFENKEIKRLFILFFCILFFFIIISIFTFNYLNENLVSKTNNIIENIILKIEERYPDINQEDIVEILNTDIKSSLDTNILTRYGINDDISVLSSINQYKSMSVTIIIVLLIISNVVIIVIIYIYLTYRKRKIDNLITYIDNIQNNKYLLDIEDNSEDELNSLKNELYKLTVMLKEKADDSKAQKEDVYRLLSDISHQLKTPLTSIQILLDNLNESKYMDEQTRRKFIIEITKKVESMNWLIIALLKLSKLDANAVEFKNERIDVCNMIKEVIENLSIMAEIRNIEIMFESKDTIYIQADYNWYKEAISNILKNAIEHAKHIVTIKVTENKVYTQIEIKDDGVGINKKDMKHIFDRFYKSQNSDENSIGIGLSLSKSIVEAQNGHIYVDSKDGEYTKFIIRYIK